jgi:hypothetical protein
LSYVGRGPHVRSHAFTTEGSPSSRQQSRRYPALRRCFLRHDGSTEEGPLPRRDGGRPVRHGATRCRSTHHPRARGHLGLMPERTRVPSALRAREHRTPCGAGPSTPLVRQETCLWFEASPADQPPPSEGLGVGFPGSGGGSPEVLTPPV